LQTRELDTHREQGSSPEHLTRLMLQALHLFKVSEGALLQVGWIRDGLALVWPFSVAPLEPFGDGDLGADELALSLTH
jgi:hypothetical protein